MKINTRRENDCFTIEVNGRIDVYTASAVGEAIQSALAGGALNIKLDLSSVSVVDSSGLGTLVGNAQTLRSMGGHISIVGMRPRLKKVLEITGLYRYFDIDAGMDEDVKELQLTGVGETPGL